MAKSDVHKLGLPSYSVVAPGSVSWEQREDKEKRKNLGTGCKHASFTNIGELFFSYQLVENTNK